MSQSLAEPTRLTREPSPRHQRINNEDGNRQIPISPELRKVRERRQHGKTAGPNPQTFAFREDHYVFGNEAGGRDLWHEAGPRKLEAGWPLHAVSACLGHTKLETTAKYLTVTTQYLHELNERKLLTLVRA